MHHGEILSFIEDSLNTIHRCESSTKHTNGLLHDLRLMDAANGVANLPLDHRLGRHHGEEDESASHATRLGMKHSLEEAIVALSTCEDVLRATDERLCHSTPTYHDDCIGVDDAKVSAEQWAETQAKLRQASQRESASRSEIDRLNEEFLALQRQNEALNSSTKLLEEKLANAHSMCEQTKESLAMANERVKDTLNTCAEEEAKRMREAQKRIAEANQVAKDSAQRAEEAERDRKKVEENLSLSEKRVEELLASEEASTNRIQEMEREMEDTKREMEDTKREMEDTKREMEDTKRDLIRSNGQYSTLIEEMDALKGTHQRSVVELKQRIASLESALADRTKALDDAEQRALEAEQKVLEASAAHTHLIDGAGALEEAAGDDDAQIDEIRKAKALAEEARERLVGEESHKATRDASTTHRSASDVDDEVDGGVAAMHKAGAPSPSTGTLRSHAKTSVDKPTTRHHGGASPRRSATGSRPRGSSGGGGQSLSGTIVVHSRSKEEVHFDVEEGTHADDGEGPSSVRWSFTSQPSDVAFQVLFRPYSSTAKAGSSSTSFVEEEIKPLRRVPAHKKRIRGDTAARAGKYVFRFDNAYSRFRKKVVSYEIEKE